MWRRCLLAGALAAFASSVTLRAGEPAEKSFTVHPIGHVEKAGSRTLIALSLCKIVSVNGNAVEIEKIDALQGTPVLDLKPYALGQDSASGVRVPDWAKPTGDRR